MTILLVIFRKRWARKQSKGHDSGSVTVLAPEVEMVESSVGHETRESDHSTVKLAGHAPVEHSLDNRRFTRHLKHAHLALIRGLGFDRRNDVSVGGKLQVPLCLPASHNDSSPLALRGSFQLSIDSFYLKLTS